MCSPEDYAARAEYALGKAIRKGQEEGTVMRPGDNGHTASNVVDNHIARIDELLTASERHSRIETGNASVYDISDGVSEEEFEEAIEDARSEGNLSRANVVRKIRQQASPQTRDQRAEEIERLAREGRAETRRPSASPGSATTGDCTASGTRPNRA